MGLPAWRRNQIAVTVAAVLVFGGFTLVLPFLPFYVAQLGISGRAVNIWSGVLLSVSPFLAAVMAPLWGRLADRYGMKIMVQRTTLSMVVHWVLMAFAQSVWHLLALRIFLGSFSGFSTMSVALVTHGAPKEKIGSIVGTLQAAQILAAAAGPFVGGVLYEAIGLRMTCLVTALFCSCGFALVSYAYDDRDPAPSPDVLAPPGPVLDPRGGRTSLGQMLRLPGFAAVAFVLFFATVFSRSFALATPIVVRDLAMGAAGVGFYAGVAVSVGWFAEAISSIVQGRISSHVPPKVLIFSGLVLASVAVLPMMMVRDVASFTILRAAQGLAAGGTLTLGYTIGGGIIPERSRAMGYGLLSSCSMLGGAFGPTLAGLVSYGWGMSWVFAASGIGYAALAMVALRSVRREIASCAQPATHPYIPVPR